MSATQLAGYAPESKERCFRVSSVLKAVAMKRREASEESRKPTLAR